MKTGRKYFGMKMRKRAGDNAAARAQALLKISRQEERFPKQSPAEIRRLGEQKS
jgi:hypothetical protein